MNFNDLAEKTRNYLMVNRKSINLSFISDFPKNSCEISALVLGFILNSRFPEKDIFIVKAESRKCGRHFWLKVEGEIFDITADQFEGVDFPIIGKSSSPLHLKYEVYEEVEISFELARHEWRGDIQLLPEIAREIFDKS